MEFLVNCEDLLLMPIYYNNKIKTIRLDRINVLRWFGEVSGDFRKFFEYLVNPSNYRLLPSEKTKFCLFVSLLLYW